MLRSLTRIIVHQQEDSERVYPCGSLLVSNLWGISDVLGAIGWVIVLFAFLLFALSGQLRIHERVRSLIPDSIVQYLKKPAPVPSDYVEEERSEFLRGIGSALRQAGPHASVPAKGSYFTIGDTKHAVRRVQGAPTEATDTAWHYGESTVYFVGDRVVNWSSSAQNPLKVR